MPDIMTPEERSERMSRVRNKNTKPEKRVRSILHGLGYRFRLHNGKLPGKPDIVLHRHHKVILIHGCYWHRHGVCRPLSIPENNPDKWRKKFEENVERDRRNLAQLKELGWNVLVIWECETKDEAKLREKLLRFMTGE
jgi:DNA mismatch endonuclease (patch repair protein)